MEEIKETSILRIFSSYLLTPLKILFLFYYIELKYLNHKSIIYIFRRNNEVE